MTAKVPLKPTIGEEIKSGIYSLICIIAGFFLILGIGHLIFYYIYLLRAIGFYNKESITICIYIIGGTSALLFIYKDKMREIFKVRKND